MVYGADMNTSTLGWCALWSIMGAEAADGAPKFGCCACGGPYAGATGK